MTIDGRVSGDDPARRGGEVLYRLSPREMVVLGELYDAIGQLWSGGLNIDIDSDAGAAASYLQSWIDGLIGSGGVVSPDSLSDIEWLANDTRDIAQVGEIVEQVWRLVKNGAIQ